MLQHLYFGFFFLLSLCNFFKHVGTLDGIGLLFLCMCGNKKLRNICIALWFSCGF